jgi:hypothetical protein
LILRNADFAAELRRAGQQPEAFQRITRHKYTAGEAAH